MLEDKVKQIKPKKLLDVGCRHGEYVHKLADFCKSITAIDVNPEHLERASKEFAHPKIEYIEMDAQNLKFPDNSFDTVIIRATLHHIMDWIKVLDEIIRVSSKYILVEEPVDDFRTQEKINSYRGNCLYLELHQDLGYTHNNFISPAHITGYFDRNHINYDSEIEKHDELYDFDDFFDMFAEFAVKSKRGDFWMDRLTKFRKEMQGQRFSRSDLLFISAQK